MSTAATVAFLGPTGTFSHEAALKLFPHGLCSPGRTAREVFSLVSSGAVDYGILPVENSTTGLVGEFFSLLVNQPFTLPEHSVKVRILKELYLQVRQHLLASKPLRLADVRRIYTIQQAYAQSSTWIDSNLRGVEVELTASTAAAAEKLSEDPTGVCIGGDFLAKQADLVKIAHEINDNLMNVTRFFIVSAKHTRIPQGSNKTTLAIMIPDRQGTLVRALGLVSGAGLDIVSLRMTPATDLTTASAVFKDWFVLDIAAHSSSDEFLRLLDRFRHTDQFITEFKLLGSYVSGWSDAFTGRRAVRHPPAPAPSDPARFIEELVSKGESEQIEFKSSLRYDPNSQSPNRELARAVAKTICGFLNADGGYLLIGVSDDGSLVGIEKDISSLTKKSVDGFKLTFYQAIADLIGKDFAGHVHAESVRVRDRLIWYVRVEMSVKPAFLLRKDGHREFFLRVGASTQALDSKETNDYIASRFLAR